jgi:hypothetical protein
VMSRHLWNTARSRSDHPHHAEADPDHGKPDSGYLRIFAATMRALSGLATQPASAPRQDDEVDLPAPRPAPDAAEPVGVPDEPEEITVEFSRSDLLETTLLETVRPETTEPALFLLPRGRHSLR